MKRFICIVFAIVLCLSSVAFADKMELPTNTSGSVYLNLNFAGVKQHLFEYDVTVDFSEASFEYSYSGEYKVNPNNDAVDYSGISGSWTDNEASLSITCNTGSDAIQVYVNDDCIEDGISDYTKQLVTITGDNKTTKETPELLSAGKALTITYTASGEIPYNAISVAGNGDEFIPASVKAEASNNIYNVELERVTVFITDEFGSGMDTWY